LFPPVFLFHFNACPEVDLSPAAVEARGGSGADCEGWVRRALGAARRQGRAPTLEDLLHAIRAGRGRLSPGLRRRIAIHEAGHAIVGMAFGAAPFSLLVSERGGEARIDPVSDDITRYRAVEGSELMGTSPDLTRHHMEVRGLGVINVMSIFGVGSVRLEKRLDLVVTLRDWAEMEDVDRTGLDQSYFDILGVRVPHVTIPVRTGRDLARLVEVAALDQKLKGMGRNSAQEFNERLLALMQQKGSST